MEREILYACKGETQFRAEYMDEDDFESFENVLYEVYDDLIDLYISNKEEPIYDHKINLNIKIKILMKLIKKYTELNII